MELELVSFPQTDVESPYEVIVLSFNELCTQHSSRPLLIGCIQSVSKVPILGSFGGMTISILWYKKVLTSS